MLALRRSRSPVRRNNLSGYAHAASDVVLCHLSLYRDPSWRKRQGASEDSGVTYKTAWRIGHQIRDFMGKVNSFQKLKGHVEIDETIVGGHRPMSEKMDNKSIIMGMKECSGRIETRIIPDTRKDTLRGVLLDSVEKGSTVSTNESSATSY